ncbi:MAG: metal-dependent transcriptional regulator [Planctomycetota bacterium]|jgi:DtxR family Mn-dependent transcriptional regulator
MPETKKDNISASLEDYLEAIFNLADDDGCVRSIDIAHRLDVAKPSVTGALRILNEKGLVRYKPYEDVTLTRKGKKLAAGVVHKHNILKSFFINVLGINVEVAQSAACKAEHALGAEVIERLLAFIEFMTKKSRNGCSLMGRFKKFCRTNPGNRKK